MTRTAVLPALAASVLVPLLGSFWVRAAEQPPFPPGTIITVAGTAGRAGFSGDGGLATKARLDNPLGLAMDAAGDLLIGDAYNARVRRVSPDGTITTIAGGPPGFTGDGGPAVKARFAEVNGLAVDAAGNLFITDPDNNRVRKIDAAGIITTVAGGGHPADGVGDGGPALAARLANPVQLAADKNGNLFVTDWQSQRVRKVDAAGMISTVAGGGQPADGRGDGGPGTQAHLSFPLGLAVDEAGNLYIADTADNRVRRVSPAGEITTAAGGGNPTNGLGDNGPAAEARLDGPQCLAVDAGGNLFIGENHGERVRMVSPAGIITTVVGTGQVGHAGDSGPAIAAQLDSPTALCIDPNGNMFIAEGFRYAITIANGVPVFKHLSTGNMVVREVIGVAVPR